LAVIKELGHALLHVLQTLVTTRACGGIKEKTMNSKLKRLIKTFGIIVSGVIITFFLILILTALPGVSQLWFFTSAAVRHALVSIGISDITAAKIANAVILFPNILAFFVGSIFVGYFAKEKAIVCGILTAAILACLMFLHTVSIYPTSSTFPLDYMVLKELVHFCWYVGFVILGAYIGKRVGADGSLGSDQSKSYKNS